MGLIYSQNFVDVPAANISSVDGPLTNYAAVNIFDRWHYARSYRSNTALSTLLAGSGAIMTLNFGVVGQTIAAIAIFGYNANAITIQGHATDSWASPAYNQTFTGLAVNPKTTRMHLYKALTGFAYQYMRIFFPTSASAAIGSYTTKCEICTLCLLSSVTELVYDMDYGYGQEAEQFYKDIDLSAGHMNRISHGTHKRWVGSVTFGERPTANEDELWTFGAIDVSQPFIVYENQGDEKDVYLCVRDGNVSVTRATYGTVTSNTMKLREMI
jgi:hypothetical protein